MSLRQASIKGSRISFSQSHVAYTLGNNIMRNSDDGGREEESCYVFTPLKAISNNAKADSLGSGDKGMFSGVLRLRCGETD